ncbi:regulatory protein RecX [Paraglaciecola aestuariivivens]
MTEKDTKIIKSTLTRLLAAREHSKHELLTKLLERNFDYDLSIEWIEKFNQHNLQSEQRFAEALIRGRVNKGIGELRVLNELKQHKIPPEVINLAFEEEPVDWFELAIQVHAKKYKNQPIIDHLTRQKRQRFLYSRGFSQEQIHYALNSNKY